MKTDTVHRRPYTPSFIHAFYAWLDRSPIPAWVLFLLLMPLVGLLQHVAAWSKGSLAPGQFNFDLGTAGYWLAGILLIGSYVLKGASLALDEYRPLLNVTEDEYARLRYRFVTIPNGPGTAWFLAGAAVGALSGFSDMAVAPAIDYVLPQLRLGIWIFGTALTLPFLYQVIRQLQQMRAFYAMPERVSPYNLRPLYGFSRYTAVLGITIFAYEALIPSILDSTAFQSRIVLTGSLSLTPLILLMFYLPFSGVHQRLVSEKERLLEEVNARIATMLERIHSAAFERQAYEDVASMRAVFSTLNEERETIQDLRTWPWRPGTLTGFLSALFLPVLLVLVRELISSLLGS